MHSGSSALTIKKTPIRRSTLRDESLIFEVSLRDLWERLVHAYSLAAVSFDSDRPVAIAGLARAFSRLQGLDSSDYLIGLWRPFFVADLGWLSSKERLPNSLNIPS